MFPVKFELSVQNKFIFTFYNSKLKCSKGVETPLEREGWGGDFLSNIVGMEEQIYNMVPGLFNLQSDLVMPYIASYGTDDQIGKYQVPLRNGEIVGAIAMTEPGGGSDLQGI